MPTIQYIQYYTVYAIYEANISALNLFTHIRVLEWRM